MSYTKGFKAFDAGLICRGFRFKEGEIYEVSGAPILCKSGFHFCKDLVLTLEYYPNFEQNVYAEVEAIGDVVYEEPTKHKACTNKIKIVKVYTREEVAGIAGGDYNSGNYNSGYYNSGNRNSGNCNSGYYNSGDYNSGNCNSGYRNSGNRNSGDYNSGDYNSGDCNSGNYNSGNYNNGNYNSGNYNNGDYNNGDYNNGNRNSGYYNSGDYNSGDYNSGNYNSGYYNSGNCNSGNWNSCNKEFGFFNSEQSKTIRVFNMDCDVSLWENAIKPNFLHFKLLEGKSYKESFQESFKSATAKDISLLKALPNFNADVFFEISGIRLED